MSQSIMHDEKRVRLHRQTNNANANVHMRPGCRPSEDSGDTKGDRN